MKEEGRGWVGLVIGKQGSNEITSCTVAPCMPSFVGCTVQHIAKCSVYMGQVCMSVIQRLLVFVREGVQCCVVLCCVQLCNCTAVIP